MTIQKTCKVVLLDEVNCVFVGLHPDHIELFYNLYGIPAPGYFFNPKYKLGQWDGRIRYFHKTAKTYVKLLDEMIPKVVSLGYKISIEDRRDTISVVPTPITEDFFSHVIDPNTGNPWKVRGYQVTLVNTLIENAGGVAIAGTGSGKTSCCAALAKSYELAGNLRSLIVVPDKNLTVQTKEEYRFFGLDVGEYSGTNKDTNHQHVVSTWQALQNMPELIQNFQTVIVDECHGLKGNVLTKLVNEYGKRIPYRFGVTGTLPKEESDAFSVKVAVGTTQYFIPAHELIEQKVLAGLQINIIEHEMDLHPQYERYLDEKTNDPTLTLLPTQTYKQFRDAYFPEWGPEKAHLQRHKDRLKWIAKFLDNVRKDHKGNTLCLVNGIPFGQKLEKAIPNSIFIYGDDDMKTRKEAYDLFSKENDVLVIATVNIASTGLNIPRIFNLVYIDIGKSFVRVIQSIGRGLRKAHDKDFVHAWDICSDLKYSRSHLRQRLKYYREAHYPYNKDTIQITGEQDANI